MSKAYTRVRQLSDENAGRDTGYVLHSDSAKTWQNSGDYDSAISNEGDYSDQIITGTLRGLNIIVTDSLTEKCKERANVK